MVVSVREAKVNKTAVNSVGLRIQEIAVVLTELLPAAEEAGVVSKALEHILGPFFHSYFTAFVPSVTPWHHRSLTHSLLYMSRMSCHTL